MEFSHIHYNNYKILTKVEWKSIQMFKDYDLAVLQLPFYANIFSSDNLYTDQAASPSTVEV